MHHTVARAKLMAEGGSPLHVSTRTPAFGSNDVMLHTPEKAKPLSVAEVADEDDKRARPSTEVCEQIAHCREARPVCELRPTGVSGNGLCACRAHRVRSGASSPRASRSAFDVRRASTGSTSRTHTSLERTALLHHRQRQHTWPTSLRGSPSCAAS